MMRPEAAPSLFSGWPNVYQRKSCKRPKETNLKLDNGNSKRKISSGMGISSSLRESRAPELIKSELVTSETLIFERSAPIIPSKLPPYNKASISGIGSSSQASLSSSSKVLGSTNYVGEIGAKRKSVKVVHIKQEKSLDNGDLDLAKTENLLNISPTKTVERKFSELPVVTTIPVGGEEFIASVLAATAEESNCQSIVNSEGDGDPDASGSRETLTKDKVIQLSGDHTYFEFKSPKKKVILKITKNPEKPANKVKCLEELIDILIKENLIDSEARCMIEAFLDLPEGLIRNRSQNRVMPRPNMKYTRGVEKFASTLYFYSPRAYDFVSRIFILPEASALQTTLRVWNHLPGFTQEALLMLKNAFSNASHTMKLCSIMIVNVKIKEQCDFDIDSGKVFGHVDFGGGQDLLDSDEVPVATDVLLFVVVGLAFNWKVPFGYFLNNGLSGEFLKSLVNEAIIALEESNLEVRTLVCDGRGACLSLGKLLGCKIKVKTFRDIETSFPHPIVSDRKMHLIFNASHGLALLRNLLVDKGTLQSTTYGKIEWKFLKLLLETSGDEYTSDCSQLDQDASEFYRQRLKLKLGFHSIGNSVGKVLELVDEHIFQEFEGYSSTANFAADIDRAFDTLNSRNPVLPGERSPMYQYTVEEQKESLTFVARRMMGLEMSSGKRVVDEGRRMSVIAFAFTLKGVSQLASELVNRNIVRYLCTYRLNLDHAGMILSCLQRIGGWYKEPSAVEFRAAYKKLLTNSSAVLRENTLYTNDFEGEDVTIGQGIIYPYRSQSNVQTYNVDVFINCKSCLVDSWSENMYRARFVAHHVARRLACSECIEILLDDDYKSIYMNLKANEIQLTPSRFVHKLIKKAEERLKVHFMQSQSWKVERLVTFIFHEYSLLNLLLGVKENAHVHFAEEPHHVICLSKVVIRTFLSLRLNNYSKVLKRII